ncbi:MAG: dynamin family protein [Cyanobacteria bacterium J06582_2]
MNLTQNLSRLYQTRLQIGDRLNKITDAIDHSNLELPLERELQDLKTTADNLRSGVFRLLVLGDLKRGKSTFLNALLGEQILPSDVNPCTALLTILRYGTEPKAIVYFQDDRSPEHLDLKTFKQQYTIDADEAKQLQQNNTLAFPEVKHAVIEYPLAMLAQGVEIIDSPGLNDTEARNKLSLEYVYSCQAVLFVMRAIQPVTMDERRYLENYLQDRGLAIFFLLNGWDEIRKGLVDLDNQVELEAAENKIRQVFDSNLRQYCQVAGQDLYQQRVFEISALNTLRQKLKHPDVDLSETGFGQFTQTLDRFLTTERAATEFKQAQLVARQTCDRLQELVSRRIPLLKSDIASLKAKIASVKPEFAQLQNIKHSFSAEIMTVRDRQTRSLVNSFENYVLKLGDTFETDFASYQPSLEFIGFLRPDKREEFNRDFKQAFERYLLDKLARWELIAEKELELAFLQLADSAATQGANYRQLINRIDEKLIGDRILIDSHNSEDDSPGWAKWAMGFFSLATGNVAGVALAAVGFNWKNILVNWLAVIGISSFLIIFTGILINPIGIALTSLGVGAIQADRARQELLKATKAEFVKNLPTIAQKQQSTIKEIIEDCFNNYHRQVIQRIEADIAARQAELDTLLVEQENQGEQRQTEIQQLQNLLSKVSSAYTELESLIDRQ